VATVIAVYNGYTLVGRCDARCHNAKGPDCHCVCGGALHGIGNKAAAEDCRHLTEDEIVEETVKLFNETGRAGTDTSSLSVVRSGGPVKKKALRVFKCAEQLDLFPADDKISSTDSPAADSGPEA
jgi:hypothetical protein